ncbi:MAG TPA: VTT domain-containing protein [Thermohalobaculum sp.]|nr:VTT domain-containing protein [Thermohalobaculum sp.]
MTSSDEAEREAEAVPENPPRKPRRWLRFVPIAVIAAGALLAWLLAGDRITYETLEQNREALIAWRDRNMLGAALAYAAIYVVSVAFSVPGAIWLTMAGGFMFGTVLGTVLTVVSATIGATLIFLAARSSLGAELHRRAGPWKARVDREVERGEISFLLVIRLIPAIPFFIANVVPAFVKVKPVNFVWTTFVGIAPASAVISSVGAGLGEVIDRGGKPDPGVIFEPYVLGPLLGLALLAALPVIVRKIRGDG